MAVFKVYKWIPQIVRDREIEAIIEGRSVLGGNACGEESEVDRSPGIISVYCGSTETPPERRVD